MIILAYYIVEKKVLFIIITLSILYILRSVNVFLMIPVISSYLIIFSNYSLKIKIVFISIFSIIFLIFLSLYSGQIIEMLNQYRIVRAREDGLVYINLALNIYELIKSLLYSYTRFLFLPNLLNSSSFLEVIQSLENIAVILLLIYFFYKLYSFNKMKSIFWLICLIFIAGVYGYVQTNVGSLVRYKYVFVAMYFIILTYEIKYNKLKDGL